MVNPSPSASNNSVAHGASRFKPSVVRTLFVVIFFCATLQFVRFYVTETPFYLDLPAYLAGRERLPFQARVLPALLIKAFSHSPFAQYTVNHHKGAFTPARAPLFLIDLAAMLIAGVYTQRLYMRVSKARSLSFLVYPLFLFTMMWTYSIHLEANFAYPYDMLAVAFFVAGIYHIYCRQFLPLLAVISVGTFNRETTLLLLPIYLFDAYGSATHGDQATPAQIKSGSDYQIPWLRCAMLLVVWIGIRILLLHKFMHNDRSEDYIRLKDNFHLLTPRLWPALLNVCGYLLPFVVVFHKSIQPERFRRYLWVLPIWIAVMLCKAVIVETRIYGELCPYVAIAAVLLMEDRASHLFVACDIEEQISVGHSRSQKTTHLRYREEKSK